MEQTRTIERSRDDRVVFGVCGGVARALDIDPTIIRVVTVVLVALGGVGLVAYVVAALVLPEEDGGRPIVDLGFEQRDRTTTILGLLVVAAVLLLLWGDGLPNADHDGLIVLAAVGIGAWLLLRERRRKRDAARADAATETETTAAAATTEPAATATTAVVPVRPADTRPMPIRPEAAAGAPGGPGGPTPTAPPAAPAGRTRRRRASAIAWGLVLLGLAAGAVVLQAATEDPSWDLYAAASVALVGGVLVLTAPFGGARGLVVCGFLLAAGVGVASASDLSFDNGAGERTYRPTTLAELRDEYRLGFGSMTLDLSGLELPEHTTTTVDVEVGAGEALIDVPADADVVVEASAGAGELVVLDERNDGFDVDTTRVSEGSGDARLVIDAHVGFGHIDVERAGVEP